MGAMVSQPKAPRTFDDSKLASMLEPLTIRVEKRKGNTRTPIPLPDGEGDDAKNGSGWAKDDLRNFEQWLVTEWAGGGFYEITVTDSTSPPITMKWEPFWAIAQYPEIVPPPLRDVTQAAGVSNVNPTGLPYPLPHPPPNSPQARLMTAFPNGFPSGNNPGFQQPQQQQPFYVVQSQPQTLPAPPPIGTPAWPQWQAEHERQKRDEEMRALREQNATREREALEAKHKAELEQARERARAEQQATAQRFEAQAKDMSDLRNMIASLAQTLQQGSTKNPEIEALKEQNRMLQEKMDREATRADAERRDRELREQIKAQADQSQRQFDAMQRQFEQTIKAMTEAASNNKSDPMLSMMQEQARQNATTMQELSRNQTAQLEKFQAFMMNPRDMIAMAQENSRSADAAAEKVTRLFGSVIDVQQKVTENLLQMQPGGSGALDLVRDGVIGLKEVAEKYVGAKSAEARMQGMAQVQIAEAQARAWAEAQSAQQHQHQQPPQQLEPTPAMQGLAGVQMPANANGMPNGAPNGAPKSKKRKGAATVEVIDASGEFKRLGRTDREWFGPALPEMVMLREGVDRFLESCRENPPRANSKGQIDGTSPEQAATYILQATTMAMQQQLPIAALIDLMLQERYADFLDVLLPGATQPYRDDTINYLVDAINQLKRLSGLETDDEHADADDDPDGDDDDDDADDDADDVEDAGKGGGIGGGDDAGDATGDDREHEHGKPPVAATTKPINARPRIAH